MGTPDETQQYIGSSEMTQACLGLVIFASKMPDCLGILLCSAKYTVFSIQSLLHLKAGGSVLLVGEKVGLEYHILFSRE